LSKGNPGGGGGFLPPGLGGWGAAIEFIIPKMEMIIIKKNFTIILIFIYKKE
jgi:hypothetical protein